LRISLELAHKRLIVGGFERIYEIGRVFRNEGLGREYLQEFDLLELYWAYATVEDLVPFTERMVATIVKRIHGSTRPSYQGKTLNVAPPWPRLTFVDAVREATGVNVLTERTVEPYLRALDRLGVAPPEDRSLPNLIDELFTEGVRKKTLGPVHVLDAPAELVPLAKRRPDEPKLVQRLQVVAAGMELVNAYTEENDPVEQEARFREQVRLRGGSDIHPVDAEYIEALKIGLPPTAGWGLGVDRLVMLAANVPSIRDVLFFPLLRPRHD
jgi:lysyl-tRNA synthetase class 2